VQYLERVLTELGADSRLAESAQRGFEGKLEALDRLSRWDGKVVDEDFLEDMSHSSSWAWDLPTANAITFSEMQSTGRLALIRDPSLRAALGMYYSEHEDQLGSIDARRTAMGPLSYQLLRRDLSRPIGPDGSASRVEALSEFEVRAFVDPQNANAVRRAALAELNFAGYAARRMEIALARAERLAGEIREYLAVTAS
jgi:hypothetical protein